MAMKRYGVIGLLLMTFVGFGSCSDETGRKSNDGDDEISSSGGLPRAIQDELVAAAATTTSNAVRSMSPVLKCVDKIAGTNNYRAHFGFTNGTTTSISIPVGFFNRFFPSPQGRGQPTVFPPGAQSDVIQLVFGRTSQIVWILGINFQVATANSKLCPPAGGTGGSGTGGAGAGGAGGHGGVAGTGGTAGKGGAGGAGGAGGTGGAGKCPATCDDHNPCTIDTCNASTSYLCSNVAGPDGLACSDGNACTSGDKCAAGVCAPGAARVCTAIDQCHSAGVCNPTTGACSTPVATNGTSCNDGSACTIGDQCQNGSCVPGTAKVCSASDQCHRAGTCAPATGICSNPAVPDGTPCDDQMMCTLQDACSAGICTPAVTLAPTHCVGGTVCDDCTTANCVPDTDGCDPIADPGDRQLCENLYAGFTNPTNACVSQGDPLACWCGTNTSTCFTDNSAPTQANGPCLQQVFAAAKSTDAATIKLRLIDPDFPIGRAVNLTSCRGVFCSSQCSVL